MLRFWGIALSPQKSIPQPLFTASFPPQVCRPLFRMPFHTTVTGTTSSEWRFTAVRVLLSLHFLANATSSCRQLGFLQMRCALSSIPILLHIRSFPTLGFGEPDH